MWDYMRLHCTQSIALHNETHHIDFFPTEKRIGGSEKRGWVKNPNGGDEFFNYLRIIGFRTRYFTKNILKD